MSPLNYSALLLQSLLLTMRVSAGVVEAGVTRYSPSTTLEWRSYVFDDNAEARQILAETV